MINSENPIRDVVLPKGKPSRETHAYSLEEVAQMLKVQFHLAFSLLQQSQNQQAVELLKRVLAGKPDHPEANYELGKELRAEGKADEAVNYLEGAVRLKSEFEPAHYQLQAAYRTLGRKEDADREARVYQALKSKSRNITLPAAHEPTPGPAD